MPRKITICLPDSHCNIGGENPTPETACIMCSAASTNWIPREEHTDQIVASLKPLLEHLRMLEVHGVAEAFWKDRLFHILDQLEFSRFSQRILRRDDLQWDALLETRPGEVVPRLPSSQIDRIDRCRNTGNLSKDPQDRRL